MTTTIFSTAVNKIPYKSRTDEIEDFQATNDFYPVKDVGDNRFHVGRTSYFAPDCVMTDCAEVCKGITPRLYSWLLHHAPNARVELGEWVTDLTHAWDEDFVQEWDEMDEDEQEENHPDEGYHPDDAPADADVFVNFGDDHATAVVFKLKFEGHTFEADEELDAEIEEHATVGYAGITVDRLDGHKTVFRCPIICNDTKDTYASMIENLEAHHASNPDFHALSDKDRAALYHYNALAMLSEGLRQGNTTLIGPAMECFHAILGQPQGYALHLVEEEATGPMALPDLRVWQDEGYDEAKAAVDSHIEIFKRNFPKAA